MKYQLDFKKQSFAVIGLGDTGLSIINYLNYKKANLLRVFDTRYNPPHQDELQKLININTTCHFGLLDITLFNDIDVVIISPGISIYDDVLQTAITNNKIVLGDIELFSHAISNWNSQIVGITGSNGKTTVTTLTGFLLKSLGYTTLVAGNIGTPVLTSYLDIIKNNVIPEYIVLELSSFQLETLYSMNFSVATVLNISEDHLDRYRDLLEYAYAKANIFNNCKIQVLNTDDKMVLAMARSSMDNLTFGLHETAKFTLSYTNGKSFLKIMGYDFIACSELSLIGIHNYLNVLSTLALLSALKINISDDKFKKALCEFKGLEHRMQKILEHNGVVYIEDSKGTNVGAVVAGISGLDMPVHLILGGDGKGQDFMPLRQLVATKCKSVAIIGQDKKLIEAVLSDLEIPIAIFMDLKEAVQFCINNARPGESVVLSPACASWDMFDNYKHRAQVFVDSIYENIK